MIRVLKRFLEVVFAELQKHQNPLNAFVTSCYQIFICPLSLVHFTACFHNQNAVSLKSKTDFLKIQEICYFWFKRDYLHTILFGSIFGILLKMLRENANMIYHVYIAKVVLHIYNRIMGISLPGYSRNKNIS